MVLGIYGAGGFGKEIYDMVSQYEADKWDEILFVDDVKNIDSLKGARVITYEVFKRMFTPENAKLVIAQGEPADKKLLYDKVKKDGYSLAVLVHPHAYICPDAVLEEGVVVFVGATISSTVHLGKCVAALTYALVGHDTVVGDFSQISAMTVVNGNVSVGRETFIGSSAAIRDDVSIGEKCIVSMGACVMKDVPDKVIVMGNPARVIQKNVDERVFG